MADTIDRLNLVFQDVFDDPALQVRPQTTAADVAGWDSLMHVTLIINVEKTFGVRFHSAEVAGLSSVEDLVRLIDVKQAA